MKETTALQDQESQDSAGAGCGRHMEGSALFCFILWCRARSKFVTLVIRILRESLLESTVLSPGHLSPSPDVLCLVLTA